MLELETATGPVIKVFSWYAVNEGSNWRLRNGELKTLIERELPGLLKVRPGRQ